MGGTVHGDTIIRYVATRRVPDVMSGGMITKQREGRMPRSWFKNLRMSDGWYYDEA